MDTKIRIAKIVHDSLVDGPGCRTVVFLQGCRIHCAGCQNRHLWDAEGGYEMNVEDAVTLALERGLPLTVSGGEPFDQAEALATFLILYRIQEPNKEIVVYTGYPYERLAKQAPLCRPIADVLACADVLVDGPFIRALDNDRLQWRGSSNQRAIDMSETVILDLDAPGFFVYGDPVLLDWDTPTLTIDKGDVLASAGLMADVFGGEALEPARMCGQTRGQS